MRAHGMHAFLQHSHISEELDTTLTVRCGHKFTLKA